jgi:hypothetical protein
MVPLFLIALLCSYFIGPATFHAFMALGLAVLVVPFFAMAVDRRYIGPNIPSDVGG